MMEGLDSHRGGGRGGGNWSGGFSYLAFLLF